jgi:hypothetical protein
MPGDGATAPALVNALPAWLERAGGMNFLLAYYKLPY